MATIEATLRKRTGSGAINAMRREGFVPSVIYGATENKNIKVHSKTFRDLLNTKPSSQVLIDLDVEGHGEQRVFIQDIQFDAISGEILHADFLAVNDDTVLTAKLPIKLLGEAVGVKAGGLLEQLVHSTKIKSLPKDLPLQIEADVSELKVSENLTIGDIKFEDGVTPVLDSRVLVALVAKTRVAKSDDAAAAPEQDAPQEKGFLSDVSVAIKMVIGLGNPGKKYDETRHNVGFDVLDRLSSSAGAEFANHLKWRAHIAKHPQALLVKPQTFMNESGRAAGAALRFYKWQPEEVLVIYDDVSLALGSLRFRMKGSAGGHNGTCSWQIC